MMMRRGGATILVQGSGRGCGSGCPMLQVESSGGFTFSSCRFDGRELSWSQDMGGMHLRSDACVMQAQAESAAEGRAPAATREDPGSPRRVALWDAINALVVASGGSSSHVSVARMKAVARVEEALRAFTEVEGR